jgi:uncharacterized protein YecE (DUF72 family)
MSVPARSELLMEARTGTSGWHYRHWRGRFYPPNLPAERWLEFYAARFPTVEINATFYRQQGPRAWQTWRETVPRGFRFSVKAHRFITHMHRLHDADASLARFVRQAETLKDRLGPLLYQLPPDFDRRPEYLERVRHFLGILPREHRNVVEFRHHSWANEETRELLDEYGVLFCAADMRGAAMPLTAAGGAIYARFHGPTGRYEHNYPGHALDRRANEVVQLAGHAREAWLYFNNDDAAAAVADAGYMARRLAQALGESRPRVRRATA